MTLGRGTEIRVRENQLEKEILLLFRIYDKRTHVDMQTRKWVAFCLSHFVHDALAKFVQGQKEHGGDFRKDCMHTEEAFKEVLDLFWYLIALRYKNI